MKSELDYTGLPEHIRDGVKLYIEHGIEPGSFMEAIICNDLCEACGRADHINRYRLFDIVSWFYNEAPPLCWGSTARYLQWLEKMQQLRARARDGGAAGYIA